MILKAEAAARISAAEDFKKIKALGSLKAALPWNAPRIGLHLFARPGYLDPAVFNRLKSL